MGPVGPPGSTGGSPSLPLVHKNSNEQLPIYAFALLFVHTFCFLFATAVGDLVFPTIQGINMPEDSGFHRRTAQSLESAAQ